MKRPSVGDIWRERYHSLALHNQVKLNHMPYLPWPPNWTRYLPKNMISGWLETYAWAMECNVWTSTAFLGAEYDDAKCEWAVRLRRADGSERVMRLRHLIFANGIAGKPLTPKLPGLDRFKGGVVHTHDYGEVGLLQHEDTDHFVENGMLMMDGRVEPADLIVTATGSARSGASTRPAARLPPCSWPRPSRACGSRAAASRIRGSIRTSSSWVSRCANWVRSPDRRASAGVPSRAIALGEGHDRRYEHMVGLFRVAGGLAAPDRQTQEFLNRRGETT